MSLTDCKQFFSPFAINNEKQSVNILFVEQFTLCMNYVVIFN